MNGGDTAWMLMATALVLFMTPGLAFFYGGMVRSKHMLGMLMQNFFAMGLLAVLWVIVVFSLAFGGAGNGGLIGNFDYVGMHDVAQSVSKLAPTIPFILFAAYQMTFAIITPALITGATADRLKFSAYAVFIGLWLVLVYAPVAHWVFAGGWLAKRGALDFAGGAVVHMNAGAAALAVVLVVGARRGHGKEPMPPHSLPWTLHRHGHLVVRMGRVQRRVGARCERHRGAGDHEHVRGRVRGDARLAAHRAHPRRACHDARRRIWRRRRARRHHSVRRVRDHHAGAAHRVRRGIHLLPRTRHQGTLQVRRRTRRHRRAPRRRLVRLAPPRAVRRRRREPGRRSRGIAPRRRPKLLGEQALASVATLAFSFTVSWILAIVIHRMIGMRITPAEEDEGMDLALHSESAYAYGDLSSGRLG